MLPTDVSADGPITTYRDISIGTTPERIIPIVDEFPDVFSEVFPSRLSLPTEFSISVTDPTRLPHASPRRMSPVLKSIVDDEVRTLLELGIIRPSSSPVASPVASPVVMVMYPDGRHRMCIDYSQLNGCIDGLRYLLRFTADVIERLSGHKYFAHLDLIRGYQQIPVAADTIPYLAFVTHSGFYEYVKLPFGLKSAPSFFQQLMDSILQPLLFQGCDCYIDDIIIYGDDLESFLHNLHQVLSLLSATGLRVRRSKCFIGFSSIELLGFVVNGDGTKVSPRRLQQFEDLVVPTSVKQLRSYLGLANYFRQYIDHFATLAQPLFALSTGDTLTWDEPSLAAFHSIKQAVLSRIRLYFLTLASVQCSSNSPLMVLNISYSLFPRPSVALKCAGLPSRRSAMPSTMLCTS